MKSYAPYQFAFFRILLGLYLCIHFADLIPYAAEIWSNEGILADPSLNLTYGFIPNLLSILNTSFEVTVFVSVLLVLSILFLLGIQRPIVSLLLWYGWVCLFDRNNLISNPGIPYIGWILLCCAVIPKGEPLCISTGKSDKEWRFPLLLFIGAWALMSIGYTISGVDKFLAPSWRDGSAIFHLLENPLARNWGLRNFFLELPSTVHHIMTWSILALEVLFLPLAILKLTRKWVWLAMIGMHLGILLIVNFADLTIGMLMIHFFTFDSRWLKPKSKASGIVFFDGYCGICNSLVDFLMTQDTSDTLVFAPLQGSTAKKELEEEYLQNVDTIVFKQDGKTHIKSNAVLFALASIGGIWKLFLIFRIIPRFIRDAVYAFFAKNRYAWFGKKEACRMPTPEERNKILE